MSLGSSRYLFLLTVSTRFFISAPWRPWDPVLGMIQFWSLSVEAPNNAMFLHQLTVLGFYCCYCILQLSYIFFI